MTLPGPAAAEGASGRELGTCQSHKEACKRAERPRPALCRPGPWAVVSASTWLCGPSARLACAPLSCVLVIPSALFQTFCGPALPFHPPAQVRGASGGRCRTCLALMPPQASQSVATKGPHPLPVARTPSHLPGVKPMAFQLVAATCNLDIPYGFAIGEKCSICHCIFARFLSEHFAQCGLVHCDLVSHEQLMYVVSGKRREIARLNGEVFGLQWQSASKQLTRDREPWLAEGGHRTPYRSG